MVQEVFRKKPSQLTAQSVPKVYHPWVPVPIFQLFEEGFGEYGFNPKDFIPEYVTVKCGIDYEVADLSILEWLNLGHTVSPITRQYINKKLYNKDFIISKYNLIPNLFKTAVFCYDNCTYPNNNNLEKFISLKTYEKLLFRVNDWSVLKIF